MYRLKKGLIFFLILFGTCAKCQIIDDFSENSLPLKETILFRSASLLPNSSWAQLGSINYSNSLVSIHKNYAQGGFAFGENKNKAFGFQFFRKDRGNLINETSIKASYKHAIPLSEKIKLATAVNAGMYFITLEPTVTTPGGSGSDLGIDWSMALTHEKWSISAYFGNINKPNMSLFRDTIFFQQYFGAFMQRTFIHNETLQSDIQLNGFYQNEEIAWRYTYELEWNKKLAVALNGNHQSLGMSAGILGVTKANFDLKLGYAFPFAGMPPSILRPLQVHLKFNFGKD